MPSITSQPRALLVTAALLLTARNTLAADIASLLRQGNGLFARGKFEEALGVYQRAEALRPDDLRVHYNIGNTLFRLNRHEEAISELTLAAVDKNSLRRANALYNIGNVQYRRNRLDDAINAYRLALLANPNDQQAKQNLEFCLKKKQEQQQQQNQQQQNQQQQNQQQSQQPQPRRSEMDRQQAERILEQIRNQERRTQREARQEPPPRQVEKDW